MQMDKNDECNIDFFFPQILVGIKNACNKRKESWRLEDDSDGRFAAEMMTIVDFTQVKNTTTVDFTQMKNNHHC